MRHLQKEKGKATTISIIIAIIVALTTTAMTTITTPVQATTTTTAAPITTTNNTATAATAATSSSGIKLSSQPIYQEHLRVVNMTPINETHMSITFSGNGVLTLPNTTQTINTSSNGSALISFETLSVQGKETIKTEDSSSGGETATATIYEIDKQPDNSTGESKGVVIAVVNTNSTTSSTLAPLNGKILFGIDNIQTTTSESDITLWEWENGVSSSDNSSSNNDTATAAAGAAATSSSGIKLSSQPIYQEWSPEGNITPINQTHGIFTFNGNGMLTLPNTTQAINTSHNGTAIISFATSSGYGKETIRTENGETVTATVYEIVQPNPSPSGEGKGIVTAVFQTNSTGMLAPLNGVIVAGIDDMSPSGESHVTLWRWENGSSSNNTTSSNNSTGITTSSPTTQGGALYE